MTTVSEIKGVSLGPCQICDQVKQKLYLCSRFHSTCEDCKELRENRIPHASDESQPTEKRVTFSPSIVRENFSEDPEIFCETCDRFVEAALVTLPAKMLESNVAEDTELVEAVEVDQAVEEYSVDAGFDEIIPSEDLYGEGELKQDIDNMRTALVTTYSELMLTRGELEEVSYKTEKLELDLDMMRGGINFVYFNFESILKRKEVRIEEKNGGILFVLMVRMRMVAREPYLGFFIGLEKCEGRAHSPLKKTIVLRAHNAFGKVIEKHALATFEKGQCVHPCFDLTKPCDDDGMYGYPDFLKKERILRPDMLKEGRLCLSIQIKPLH